MTRTDQERMLSEADPRYCRLRDSVADAYYHAIVKDRRVIFKHFDDSFERLTVYGPTVFEGDVGFDIAIAHESDRELIDKQVSELLAGKTSAPIEFRIERHNGSTRWVEKIVVPIADQFGQVIAYDGLFRDITARKSREEALRENEQRFRLIFEDDLTGDYVATPDGEILLCNPAFVRIFGFATREQVVGSNFSALYQDPESWRTLVRRVQEFRFIERFERAIRRSDGTVLHIVENVLGTFDEKEQLVRIKGYIFDDSQAHLEAVRLREHNIQLEDAVSERTKAVMEKHEQLQAIMNSAFDAIVTVDRAGTIQTVNRAAKRMFGYADEDMVGHNIMLLLPSPYGEDRDGHLRIFVEVGERNVTTNVREVFGRRIDGSTFPVEVSVTEVEQSQIFTCVIHDISERKQLQSHVLEIAGNEQRRIGLELHDGIGQELTGLALHAGSLVELLRTVDYYKEDRFREVDGGDASLAKARELAARISTRLNETNRHVRHLAHGIMPVQIEPEGLQTALEELATSIDLQGAVDCQFECFDSIRVLNNSVATHLYCIAQEAVNNALKHSHGDEITISLRNQGDCVVLEIRDNGIGIEAAKDQQAQPSHGMGLRTMQYRCATVSGTFRVDTRREIGTAIICLVPQAGSGR